MTFTSVGLPALEDLAPIDQAEHARMCSRIVRVLQEEGGYMDFERFMELVLYEPELGFYQRETGQFGDEGSFTTAPEMGPLFARCLAQPCRQVLDEVGGVVLEVGAGRGTLACDLLLALQSAGALPDEYLILERSAALRRRQSALLDPLDEPLRGRVRWVNEAPEMRGIVIANEVLDALPVQRFEVFADDVRPLGVTLDGGSFQWRTGPSDRDLTAWYEELRGSLFELLPVGYRSERCRQLASTMARFCGPLERGVVLFVDYGYTRATYYHPQRTDGTLMCHFKHRAHSDPFVFAGLQDVTASVDFTAVARVGEQLGMTVAGYTSQTWFLLGCGLQAVLASLRAGEFTRQAQVAKKLLMPGEMGERVHALALARGFEQPLEAFALRDRSGRLASD